MKWNEVKCLDYSFPTVEVKWNEVKCQFFIKFSCEEKVFPYNDECPEKDGEPGGGRDKKTFIIIKQERM